MIQNPTSKTAILFLAALISISTLPSSQALAKDSNAAPTNTLPKQVNRILHKTKKKEQQHPPAAEKKIESKRSTSSLLDLELEELKPKPVKINPQSASEKKAQTQDAIAQTPTSPTKEALLRQLRKLYVRADYGIGKLEERGKSLYFKKHSMYGAGLGYRFNQALRADINFQHRILSTKRAESGLKKIIQTATVINVYLNLMDENTFIIPYLVAGMGYAENKPKDATLGSALVKGIRTYPLIWNVGAGTSLRLTKNIRLETAYKYINSGAIKGYMHFPKTGRKVLYTRKASGGSEIIGSLILNL